MDKKELIQSITDSGILKTSKIIEAFKKIDRADFVQAENINEAYTDHPLPIGHKATISQPSTVAFMLELLEPKKGDKILDVGSGSAWTTALLAEIVGESGKVYGVEIIPELVEFGKQNLKKYNFKNANIELSGKELGIQDRQPFDRILVSASANQLPHKLVSQLKIDGRMVLPIQSSIWRIDKISKTKINKKEFFGFSFVPLRC